MSPLSRSRKPRRHQPRTHPLGISVIVIGTAALITFYAFNQGVPLVHRLTMSAIVRNSVNVRSESPVRIAGINIGTVSGTEADGENTKVTFTVQNDALPIHTNATVTLRDRLFLEGSYYLQIDPGTPPAPIAPDGFTIEPQNTSSPVQFYKLLSTFGGATRASLASTLNTLRVGFSPRRDELFASSGAGGLKRAIPQLRPVLKDIAFVSQSLTGTHAGDVRRLLTSASAVTTTLSDDGGNLNGLITGLNRTATALVATDGALAATIRGLDQTVRASPPALTAIDRSLAPLAALARSLTPSLKVSAPIVGQVTTAVNQLDAVVRPATRGRLLKAIRTTLTDFPAVLTELGKAFPPTTAVTGCLRTHLIPILNQKLNDGRLSTGNPVWQDFAHFLPNLAGASGNFDGNGHYVRVLAGAGDNSLIGTTGGLATLSSAVGSAGSLVGIAPGGGQIEGASPTWAGTLTPADFRPDVPCGSQPLPSLAATGAAPDLRLAHAGSVR